MVGLLALLDDIALLMKVAAKKTTGVLGDDLALNAEQLNGISAERELPIVWRVFKGSLINKVILVPLFIIVSIFLPSLVMPLLMIGGGFLCFEGVEKVLEKFFHTSHVKEDLIELTEDARVKGAVKTDFILSAEIVVISLGSIMDSLNGSPSIMKLVISLSIFSFLMTIGVYGFVALLIKLDDFGIYLNKSTRRLSKKIGNFLMKLAPFLMKALGVIGTVAMFLVGGGIIVHGFHSISDVINSSLFSLHPALRVLLSTLAEGVIGVLFGLLIVAIVSTYKKIKNK